MAVRITISNQDGTCTLHRISLFFTSHEVENILFTVKVSQDCDRENWQRKIAACLHDKRSFVLELTTCLLCIWNKRYLEVSLLRDLQFP